jgi:hypothetical protein
MIVYVASQSRCPSYIGIIKEDKRYGAVHLRILKKRIYNLNFVKAVFAFLKLLLNFGKIFSTHIDNLPHLFVRIRLGYCQVASQTF